MNRHDWTNRIAKLAADYRLTKDYNGDDAEWLSDLAEELRDVASDAEAARNREQERS